MTSIPIPKCYSEAIKHDYWRAAMTEELQALKDNDTWYVFQCLTNVKAIGGKWVYSIKLCIDGTLDCYKVQLVVLGNKQEYGVNYEETVASIAKMITV